MAHKKGEEQVQAFTATRLKAELDVLLAHIKARDVIGLTRQETSQKGVVNALLTEFMERSVEERERFLEKWVAIYDSRYYQPSYEDWLAKQEREAAKSKPLRLRSKTTVVDDRPPAKPKGKGKPA